MPTFAPAGPDSTESEPTAPSTAPTSDPKMGLTDPDDPNTLWDMNDPDLPEKLKEQLAGGS